MASIKISLKSGVYVCEVCTPMEGAGILPPKSLYFRNLADIFSDEFLMINFIKYLNHTTRCRAKLTVRAW